MRFSPMRSLLVFTVLLLACHRQSAPSQHPDNTPQGSSPATEEQRVAEQPTEVESEDICSSVTARTKVLVDGVRQHFDEASGCRPPSAGLGWCHDTSSGIWAIVLEELALNAEGMLEGEWAIVHRDARGRQSEVRPHVLPPDLSEPRNVNYSASPCYSMLDIPEPTAFDYNNDGVPELVAPIAYRPAEEASIYGGNIWTVIDGQIAPYAPAGGVVVHAVRDVDTDGRPDLVIHGPYTSLSTSCASSFSLTALGPPLLAHSLADGTFSTDDEVALAFARASCPGPPTSIVERHDEGSVDSDRTGNAVVCARLWGAETSALVAQLRRECAVPSHVARDNPCSECMESSFFEVWASTEPPLRLR